MKSPSNALVQLLPGIAAKGAEKIWKIFSAKMEDGRSKMANQPASADKSEPLCQLRPPRILPSKLRQIRSGKGGDRLGAIRRDNFTT